MKFSLLNLLFLFAVIAAVTAWQIDKSKFESILANYGEELPEPHWSQIDGANVAESFAIGDATFVILQSDISSKKDLTASLSSIEHPAVAEKSGKPSTEILALINEFFTREHSLRFENASVFDYGDEGHYWRITWSLSAINGGSSGVPYRYTAFVRGDGSRVEPRVFLCDHFGSWYSNQGDMVFSVLAIDELLATAETAPEQSELVAAAETALTLRLDELDVITKFRFASILRRSFSGKLKTVKTDNLLEVWAVNFVDKTIPATVKNQNSATGITIWVTSDLATSDISVGSWEIEAND